MDCKTVSRFGYIVVAVDHFSTYTWTTFVVNKKAEPIAFFVANVMLDVRRIRKEREGGTPDDERDTQLYMAENEVRLSLLQ